MSFSLLVTYLCLLESFYPGTNYKEVIARYNTMVLLPVEVEINSVDAGRKTKRFYDYEYHLESLVSAWIKTAVFDSNQKSTEKYF